MHFSAAVLEKPKLNGNNKTDTENSIPLDVKNLWESFTAKDKEFLKNENNIISLESFNSYIGGNTANTPALPVSEPKKQTPPAAPNNKNKNDENVNQDVESNIDNFIANINVNSNRLSQKERDYIFSQSNSGWTTNQLISLVKKYKIETNLEQRKVLKERIKGLIK